MEMLDNGADINVHNQVFGHTALIVAARFGYIKIVQALLDRGAEVNAEDNYGHTALYWAIKNKKAAVVELLEAAGDSPTWRRGQNVASRDAERRIEVPLRRADLASAEHYQIVIKPLAFPPLS